MARIVVGVDGSPGSHSALRWSLEEARLRNAELHVVNAWSIPLYSEISGPVLSEMIRDMERSERQVVDAALQEIIGDTDPGVSIRTDIVQSPPASALVEAAKGADLLVVGTRGRGGFTGLLLGSVSQQVAHHAECPVVIVPPPQTAKH